MTMPTDSRIVVSDVWVDENDQTASNTGTEVEALSIRGEARRVFISNKTAVPYGIEVLACTLNYKLDVYTSVDPSGETALEMRVIDGFVDPGSATWLVDGTATSWTTAGGDFLTWPTRAWDLGDDSQGAWSTYEIRHMMQRAVDRMPHHPTGTRTIGFCIKFVAENDTGGVDNTWKSESDSHGTPADRPYFTLTYRKCNQRTRPQSSRYSRLIVGHKMRR